MKKKATASSPIKKSPLNPKQELFVLEYLKDFNAKQAAIRSGYVARSARARGWILLADEHIQTRISEKFSQVTKKVEVEVEFVLRELMQIANCNIQDAFNPDGTLKNIHDIPVPVVKAISSFNNEEIFEMVDRKKEWIGNLKKVTFWDKKGSLELLGKYLAMFIERQQHEGPGGEALPSVQVHVHRIPSPQTQPDLIRPDLAAVLQGNGTPHTNGHIVPEVKPDLPPAPENGTTPQPN